MKNKNLINIFDKKHRSSSGAKNLLGQLEGGSYINLQLRGNKLIWVFRHKEKPCYVEWLLSREESDLLRPYL